MRSEAPLGAAVWCRTGGGGHAVAGGHGRTLHARGRASSQCLLSCLCPLRSPACALRSLIISTRRRSHSTATVGRLCRAVHMRVGGYVKGLNRVPDQVQLCPCRLPLCAGIHRQLVTCRWRRSAPFGPHRAHACGPAELSSKLSIPGNSGCTHAVRRALWSDGSSTSP